MFLCLGGEPRTQWADEDGIPTDPSGYVLTGPDLLREEGARKTGPWTATRWRSRPVPRDCSSRATPATARSSGSGAAVGEGAMAVALAERRLRELEEES